MLKNCIVCGKEFNAIKKRKLTCSHACWKERARQNAIGGRRWSMEKRLKLSKKGKTKNLLKGTPAAQKSPISGPFETNQNALIWNICSPSGEKYEVRNLALWLREHAEILPGTPEQARSAFKQMKRSMQGKEKKKLYRWKGWTLQGWRSP